MIDKLLPPGVWSETAEGMDIIGCAIHPQYNDLIYILLQEHLDLNQVEERADTDEGFLVRLMAIEQTQDEPYLEYGIIDLTLTDPMPFLEVSEMPHTNALVIDKEGYVLVFGGGRDDWEDEQLSDVPFIEKVKHIKGFTWAVSSLRKVYKRQDINNWVKIDKGLNSDGKLNRIGFSDIDGFSQDDVYAIGGISDIWHYNGEEWLKCAFPATERIDAVCCGDDGFVYVATAQTTIYSPSAPRRLWKGKNNHWQPLCELTPAEKTKSMAWFQGSLWIMSSFVLHVWQDGELLTHRTEPGGKAIPAPEEFMYIGKNSVLMWNQQSVWAFDGNNWYNIISPITTN